MISEKFLLDFFFQIPVKNIDKRFQLEKSLKIEVHENDGSPVSQVVKKIVNTSILFTSETM